MISAHVWSPCADHPPLGRCIDGRLGGCLLDGVIWSHPDPDRTAAFLNPGRFRSARRAVEPLGEFDQGRCGRGW
jgi:hypothetical protein